MKRQILSPASLSLITADQMLANTTLESHYDDTAN